MLEKDQYTLKQLRQLSGLSQKELGALIGVTERTIWNYENDVENLRKVSYPQLQRVAEVLDVKVDDIFLGATSTKSN